MLTNVISTTYVLMIPIYTWEFTDKLVRLSKYNRSIIRGLSDNNTEVRYFAEDKKLLTINCLVWHVDRAS